MDGLEMAENIRQRYPSIKIVIFSGFDEFEYAKKAIKLNVIEYILKPVNVEELTAILKKIKKNLDEEIEQKRNVTLLRESYIKSLPAIREHFLNDLIHGGMEEAQIEEKLNEYAIDVAGAVKWVIAAIHLEPDEKVDKAVSLHQQRELIPISVRNLIEEKLEGQYRFIVFHSSFETILLVAIDKDNTQTADCPAGRYLQGDEENSGGIGYDRRGRELQFADGFKPPVPHGTQCTRLPCDHGFRRRDLHRRYGAVRA